MIGYVARPVGYVARADPRPPLPFPLPLAIADSGEPVEPAEEKAEAREEKTFAEVVAEYRASFMVTDLKVTSRRGYTSILVGTLLPWFGRKAVEEVGRILGAANAAHRLGFDLMAFAGLRPNEVRALRWKDVRLEWEAGKVVGGC